MQQKRTNARKDDPPDFRHAASDSCEHLRLISKGLPYAQSATICTETEITPSSPPEAVVAAMRAAKSRERDFA